LRPSLRICKESIRNQRWPRPAVHFMACLNRVSAVWQGILPKRHLHSQPTYKKRRRHPPSSQTNSWWIPRWRRVHSLAKKTELESKTKTWSCGTNKLLVHFET